MISEKTLMAGEGLQSLLLVEIERDAIALENVGWVFFFVIPLGGAGVCKEQRPNSQAQVEGKRPILRV